MLKQSPGWAIATLIAAFIAGGLVGWGVSTRVGHGRWGRGGWGAGGPGFGAPGAPGGPRGVHSFLRRELDLTPAQQDSVRAIFERHRPQMETLWREMRPRFDSVRAAIDREIAAQLTPAQRSRFEDLMRRMDNRLRKETGPPTQH
jgi:Spy/CpxP family protein refolding chaperone